MCINESLTSLFGIYEGLHINQMILYMPCIERGENVGALENGQIMD